MEFLFIVFYAAVLALVAPAVNINSDRYGSFVPTTIALATGSFLWILLTVLGFGYTDGWIWTIVMLSMPAAMYFGSKFLASKRQKQDELALLGSKTD
jgi:lipopolysaccharide export LptBFGC system permease protein LptF